MKPWDREILSTALWCFFFSHSLLLSCCRWEHAPRWVLNADHAHRPALTHRTCAHAVKHAVITTDDRDRNHGGKKILLRSDVNALDLMLCMWLTDGDEKKMSPFVYGELMDRFDPILTWRWWCHIAAHASLPLAAMSVLWPSSPSADYESLRIGGLGFAVVLFTLGILLILSEFSSLRFFPLLMADWPVWRWEWRLNLLCFEVDGAAAVSRRSPGPSICLKSKVFTLTSSTVLILIVFYLLRTPADEEKEEENMIVPMGETQPPQHTHTHTLGWCWAGIVSLLCHEKDKKRQKKPIAI